MGRRPTQRAGSINQAHVGDAVLLQQRHKTSGSASEQRQGESHAVVGILSINKYKHTAVFPYGAGEPACQCGGHRRPGLHPGPERSPG